MWSVLYACSKQITRCYCFLSLENSDAIIVVCLKWPGEPAWVWFLRAVDKAAFWQKSCPAFNSFWNFILLTRWTSTIKQPHWGREEKTNKSELWNPLTYTQLKFTFWRLAGKLSDWERYFEAWKSQIVLIFKTKKWSHFFWGWRLVFLSYVFTQDICKIDIKFSVRCMVWPSTSLFQPEFTSKILIRSQLLILPDFFQNS